METKSKTRPASNTVMFSSIFLSVAVCFVALIHVEIELHAHRQMLQVLNQQRQENRGPRNAEREEKVDSVNMLHSDSRKGEWLLYVVAIVCRKFKPRPRTREGFFSS